MIRAFLTGVSAYVSTSLDYLIILMVLFGRVSSRDKRLVYVGDLLGTSLLVAVSFVLATFLRMGPAEWVLGLLGFVPILMGLRLLIVGEKDDEAIVDQQMKRKASVVVKVAIITVATCGADNLGVYVPLFTQLQGDAVLVVLATFFLMCLLFAWFGEQLGRIPFVVRLLEQWGLYITAFVYIAIGLLVLLEAGTLQHLFFLN